MHMVAGDGRGQRRGQRSEKGYIKGQRLETGIKNYNIQDNEEAMRVANVLCVIFLCVGLYDWLHACLKFLEMMIEIFVRQLSAAFTTVSSKSK